MVGWKPSAAEKPDLVINDLDKSVILEIKASEIMTSEAFPTHCSLRFPRVMKIRYDKNWNEAMNRS
jgi:DNA ligase-4